MKVLMAHTRYMQPGGEDTSFETEATLLETGGHEVVRFETDNSMLTEMAATETAARAIWNWSAYRTMVELIEEHQPDVVHLQNTFPLLSPAVAKAAKRMRVPVVQTLRNYRLQCVNGINFRDGRICTDCSGLPVPLHGVRHGCYRGRAASAVVASMIGVHRAIGTWDRDIDRTIFLTEFAREQLARFVEPSRARVKGNCVHPDPGIGPGGGDFALFVGRLTPEKGLPTLIEAWRRNPELPGLRIVGEGPLRRELERQSAKMPRVEVLGQLGRAETDEQLGQASVVVIASEWWETFGRVVMEALARGTPTAVADIGALAEIAAGSPAVRLFRPGDPDSMAQAVTELHTAKDQSGLRSHARATFEERFTGEHNLAQLVAIYEEVL